MTQHHTHPFRLAAFAALCSLFALPTMAQYYDYDDGDDNDYAYGETNSYRNRPNYSDYDIKKCFKNIRLGANTSSVTNTGSMGLGYDASIAFIFPMKKAYFMTEAGLSMRRFDYVDLEDFDHHPSLGIYRDVHFDAVGHNVKVRPVQFGALFYVAPIIFDIHAGCFASYDYYSKNLLDNYSGFKPEYDTLPDLNRLDYGINVGLGMYIGRFNMDFTYEHGFADFFKSYTSKTNQTTFRFGLLF